MINDLPTSNYGTTGDEPTTNRSNEETGLYMTTHEGNSSKETNEILGQSDRNDSSDTGMRFTDPDIRNGEIHKVRI